MTKLRLNLGQCLWSSSLPKQFTTVEARQFVYKESSPPLEFIVIGEQYSSQPLQSTDSEKGSSDTHLWSFRTFIFKDGISIFPREQNITPASLFFFGFREHQIFLPFQISAHHSSPSSCLQESPFLLSFFSTLFLTFLFCIWLLRKSIFSCP